MPSTLPTWTRFEHTNPPTRIIAGAGAAKQLPTVLDERNLRRVLVVCGNSVSRGPQLALVRDVLGDRVTDVFVGVSAHGGLDGLLEGVDAVERSGADALLSLGGGATIDSTKCIAMLRACEEPLENYRVRKDPGSTTKPQRVPTTMPHIAMPTTAGSSSEVMPWAGIRNEKTREKMLFRDPSLIPDVAILAPELVAPTEPRLTATSGVTALARSIETLYSSARQPIAEALALQSLRLMVQALPRAVAEGQDLDARAATQVAATISGIAADNSMVSLVHAVGHVVGGRKALQHGVAHAMLLPAAAGRYLPSTGDLQHRVAESFGIDSRGLEADEAGSRATEALAGLLEALPIPHRLRDVGIVEDDIDDLADQTLLDPMFAFVPEETTRDDVHQVLSDIL